MSNHLRVEKREEPVSLFMTDGVIFEGHVYLAQYALLHSGEQTVLDLLMEDNLFLPMHSSSGEFHLVQKGLISYVRCKILANEGLEFTERRVKICFSENETLQGSLKLDMPDHSVRLTDYINRGSEFFPLFSGEIGYLVNRRLIRDIVLLGD